MKRKHIRKAYRSCVKCHMLEWDKDTCSICGGNMVTHYVGYVGILDTTSKLANSLGIIKPGEYALNIREKKR